MAGVGGPSNGRRILGVPRILSHRAICFPAYARPNRRVGALFITNNIG
ncbi:hypothetical protein J2785_006448 [Burkholderia ambifaria]|nr:hypothetical protein [Burkholderia ambifaria]